MFWTFVERLGPICLMAVVLLVSRSLAQRSQRRRWRTEAQRLRFVMSVSLRSLHSVYADNVLALGRGEVRLISGRNQIVLLRPHLGRVISLEQDEIEVVLGACIAAESAETAMAVGGQLMGGVAFRIPELGTKARLAVKNALAQTCSAFEAADAVLNKRVATAAPLHDGAFESQDSDSASLASSIGVN